MLLPLLTLFLAVLSYAFHDQARACARIGKDHNWAATTHRPRPDGGFDVHHLATRRDVARARRWSVAFGILALLTFLSWV